jgi:hypothetical protein
MRSFVRGWSSEEFIAEQVESFESLCAKRASESVSRRDKWFCCVFVFGIRRVDCRDFKGGLLRALELRGAAPLKLGIWGDFCPSRLFGKEGALEA